MIITVEVLPRSQVRLTATATTGTVTWYRSTLGVEVTVGDGAVRIDYTPALNTDVYYWASDDVDTATPELVFLPADKPLLTSTLYGDTVTCTVVTQLPYTYEGRSVAHAVLNSTAPLVTVAPMVYPTFPLRLWANTLSDAQQLRALFRRGDPIVLRTICPSDVDTVTFVALTAREESQDDTRPRGPRIIEIDAQAVVSLPEAYPLPPAWDYTDLLAVGTYDDVRATFPTYGDAKVGV